MKKLIIIFTLFFIFNSCDFRTSPKTSDEQKLFERLYLMDLYLWVNVCPPKDATLEKGTHTITLNEGEEYWFNVNTDSTPYSSYLSGYEIGISESPEQTISVGNPSCTHNGQITNPYKPKAEGKNSSYSKDGFKIYIVYFKDSLVGIKSTSGSGEIQIKVP